MLWILGNISETFGFFYFRVVRKVAKFGHPGSTGIIGIFEDFLIF
jgi:hypothetical protein